MSTNTEAVASIERTAQCACGQARAICRGEPVRISVCHCLNCKRRSGSAFAAQARFPIDQVEVSGKLSAFDLAGDDGGRATFRFCLSCGSTIAYILDSQPDLVAIPVGAFADPAFPPPHYSVYEERKHAWVEIVGDGIEHWD